MTVTTKEHSAAFPEVSVDEHVTVGMSPAVSKSVEPDVGEQITVEVPSTASVAVGVVYVSTANEPMEKSVGQPASTGATLSA